MIIKLALLTETIDCEELFVLNKWKQIRQKVIVGGVVPTRKWPLQTFPNAEIYSTITTL